MLATAPFPRVFIDFSTIGRSADFTVLLSRQQREGLSEGGAAMVEGDSVDPMPAIVVAMDDNSGEVTFSLKP